MVQRRIPIIVVAICVCTLVSGASVAQSLLSDVRFTTTDFSIECEQGGITQTSVSFHNFGEAEEDCRFVFSPPGEELWVTIVPDPAFTLEPDESYSINVTVRASVSANTTEYPLYFYLLINGTVVDNFTLTVIIIEPPPPPVIPGPPWESIILGMILSGLILGLRRKRRAKLLS